MEHTFETRVFEYYVYFFSTWVVFEICFPNVIYCPTFVSGFSWREVWRVLSTSNAGTSLLLLRWKRNLRCLCVWEFAGRQFCQLHQRKSWGAGTKRHSVYRDLGLISLISLCLKSNHRQPKFVQIPDTLIGYYYKKSLWMARAIQIIRDTLEAGY